MKCRTLAAISTTLLAMSGHATTPAGDITFTVPLNLTGLSPDISKVKVNCRIQEFDSRVIADANSETAVSGGAVVSTLSVTFQASNSGFSYTNRTRANQYSCWLVGFFEPQQIWDEFEPNHPIPAFRLEPRPIPINGNFIW